MRTSPNASITVLERISLDWHLSGNCPEMTNLLIQENFKSDFPRLARQGRSNFRWNALRVKLRKSQTKTITKTPSRNV